MGALGSKAASVAERTPLIGRVREIARLLSALRGGERLVTVTGPSGMGKTRLALRVAKDAIPHFDEIGVARLATARSASDLQGIVAEALGIAHRPGLELAASIAARGRLLLVADNLEHLVPEAAPLLERWLDRCPELQILASSIVPLGLEGEVRFELGPLAVEDATALYLDRARRAAADREFGADERAIVRELVQRLDGLPLALELAAARVRVLSPRQLLARIEERFTLLRSAERGRHGSLWEALSLSWELLSERERRLLARASVFARGFEWEAAEAVLSVEAEDGADVLGMVDGLRAKALLQFGDEIEAPRFSLYESVRAFAAQKLEELGLREDALLRHARFYVARAEQESERCHGPDAPEAIRWLLAERENLLAVQRRLADRAPTLACRAGIALAEALALGGPPHLEDEVLSAAVELAARAGEDELLCKALWRRARAYKRLGRAPEARVDIDRGLRLARARGDALMEGRLLLESAAIHSISGRLDEALGELAAVRALGRGEGVPEFEGIAWLIQGVAEENRGRTEASYEAFQHALELLREVRHLRYQGVVHLNIGAIASHLGRFDEARRNLEEAQRIFRLLENPTSEANVLLNLGAASLAEGLLDDARRWLGRALALERQLGNPRLRGMALAGLAHISLEAGEPRQAAAQLEEALAVLRPLKEWRLVSSNEPFYALCLAELGRFEAAWRVMERARAAFERVDDRASLGPIALLQALVRLREARARGNEDAEEDAAAALEAALAEPPGDPSAEAGFIARRLARRALDERSSTAPALRVGPEEAWFEWVGERVDLRRRTAVRRIFRGLVARHAEAPGAGMSAEELVEIGWPGERILPEAAAARVYSGIRTLRGLGLEAILLRHADGYLLDPEVEILRS